MKGLKKSLLLIAFAGCAVAATAATKYYGSTHYHRSAKHVPYTITWRVMTEDEGAVTDSYTETRYVSSNGNWRSVKLYADGRTEELFAESGRGVFAIKPAKRKMIYLSGHDADGVDPERYGPRNPHHVGTELVLGYAAYITKQHQGGTSVEFSHAPGLNGDMIKMVRRGDGCTLTVEPVSIVEGEPSRGAMAHEEFPADYEHHDKLHGKN